MPHDIFISYASANKTVADAACAALEAHKVRCWIAPRDVLPGTEYGESIVEAIAGCRVMVLIFSAHANQSPHIRREVERAVSKDKILLPFRIDEAIPARSLEYGLSNTHWLDALTPPLESRIAELVACIGRLLDLKVAADASPPSVRPVAPPTPPATATNKVAVAPRRELAESQRAKIVNVGELYEYIHRNPAGSNGLRWPSADIQRQAGIDGWGDWKPSVGDEGEIIAKMVHPNPKCGTICLLKVGDRYVPIGERGIELVEGNGPLTQPAPPSNAINDRAQAKRARILKPGLVYPTINRNADWPVGLQWPSAEIKKQAGNDSWGSWTPNVGDEGEIISKVPHPNSKSGMVYILKVGDRYVPIAAGGVELVEGIEPLTPPPTATNDRSPAKRAKIVDLNQLFDTINRVGPANGIHWPSPEIQLQAGKDGWGDWKPSVGDEGELVAYTPHANGVYGMICILKVGDRYVPMGLRGIKFIE